MTANDFEEKKSYYYQIHTVTLHMYTMSLKYVFSNFRQDCCSTTRQNNDIYLPSVGFTCGSLFTAVCMLLKDAGGAHCCNTPMALQN